MAHENSVRVASDLDARLKTALQARRVVLPDSVTARVNYVLGNWLGLVAQLDPAPGPENASPGT